MKKQSKGKEDQRPILCGTDFSPTAVEAVDIAAAMARHLGVKLLLLHVSEYSGLALTDPGLFEQVVLKNHQALEHEVQRLSKAGTKVESKLLSGSTFNQLVDTAVESNARLVVLGAVGHGLARRLLVGSVAERAAETSPVPTLVVRPGSTLGAWIRGGQPLKILVGFDFSEAGDAALRWVNDLQAIGPSEITVLHIDWPPDEAQRLGFHGPLPLTENPAVIQNSLERNLAERVALLLPPEKVKISVQPGWGRTDGYLFEIACREGADLVVVGTHRRHGLSRLRFGSVSRNLLHDTPVSVAVVPIPEPEAKRQEVPVLDRVLIATDFSELGNNAVRYACALTRRGGMLKLIHVTGGENQKAGKATKPQPSPVNPKLLTQLRALVPEGFRNYFDLEAEIVVSDKIPEAIAREAEELGADLICLGSHGGSRGSAGELGSVAQSVVRASKRPVLIVQMSD